MLDEDKARTLAECWINLICEVECQIVDDSTIARPYGWIFFYQSKRFLETGEFGDQIAGNGPILVDRINFNLKTFGTARRIDEYLTEFEKTIPPTWLQMSKTKSE